MVEKQLVFVVWCCWSSEGVSNSKKFLGGAGFGTSVQRGAEKVAIRNSRNFNLPMSKTLETLELRLKDEKSLLIFRRGRAKGLYSVKRSPSKPQ